MALVKNPESIPPNFNTGATSHFVSQGASLAQHAQTQAALNNPKVISEGEVSLLAERFISMMEGAHELAPVESLLKFVRTTPIFNNIPNLYSILREIEKEEILTHDEGIPSINWPRFISYFTNEPRFQVLPSNSPYLTDYERKIDKAEDLIKTIFKECMNEHGNVSTANFIDRLKTNDEIQEYLAITIGPVVSASSYLPITIEENLQKFADEAPDLINFDAFAKLFKKMQYRPDKYNSSTELKPVISDKVVSHLHEVRMPYQMNSQHSNSKNNIDQENSHTIGWSDLLFPKDYRKLNQGHHHTSDRLKTYPDTSGQDPQSILGIPHGLVASQLHQSSTHHQHLLPLSPRPHPLHPTANDKGAHLAHESAARRLRLEQQLADHKLALLAGTVKADARREAERKKREDEANTQLAKDEMYRQLKEKYQKRLEEGVHATKGAKKKVQKKEVVEVTNKEGEKRRKMQEVLRIQQEGLENKLGEEEKILLKEALLLRKMGKI